VKEKFLSRNNSRFNVFRGLEWRTNSIKIEDTEKGKVLIKEFDVIKPALIFTLYNIACFVDNLLHLSIIKTEDYYFPSVKERVENEIRARNILSELGVKHPRIHWYKDNVICMEYVDGKTILDFYRERNLKEIYEFSKRIGFEVRRVHEAGYAFIDCRAENYITRNDGEIYRLDLEFFTEKTRFRSLCDIVTYDVSILGLSEDKCMSAIRGFHDGYGKELSRTELAYISLFSSIYPLSLKEGFEEIANRASNALTLLKESIKDANLLKILKSITSKMEG
jgi:tRNA A-37 threonylcarbamoyl transferase component Bud32